MQILAIVADNATNNDSMMVELEALFCHIGIPFSAKASRLQCTPHTIHLSAMKVCSKLLYLMSCSSYHFQLLDGIGAIPSQSAEPQATPDNYQESVSEPTASSEKEQLRAPTTDVNDGASAAHILSALNKVCPKF
jgi:hypothetical protein